MPASSPGLFAVGDLEMFAVECGKTVTQFRNIKGHLAYLSDDGSGFLSKGMANALVRVIKGALKSEGTSIGATYEKHSTAYSDSLLAMGAPNRMFNLTGTLIGRIKVINRSYSGGRGHVAGVDDRGMTTHVGWKGSIGDPVKISDIIKTLTWGSADGSVPARPVIPQAIEFYMSSLAPEMVDHFWNKKLKQWGDHLSEGSNDKARFGGSLPSVAPSSASGGLRAGDTGSYVGGEDLGGMSISSARGMSLNVKKDNADLYKSAIASGMSAEDARALIAAMSEI